MTIYINDKEVPSSVFSGGECHVTLEGMSIEGGYIYIDAILSSSDEILKLFLVVDAIRRKTNHAQIDLTIPYFPYARQDRVCNPGEAISVKVMADLINSLKCEKVNIYDAHSDVTPALINSCNNEQISDMFLSAEYSDVRDKIHKENISIVSPDSGSEKKVIKLVGFLNSCPSGLLSSRMIQTDIVCCSKKRNILTGEITESKVLDDVEGKNLIIVDDICDGGRTFIELYKALKERGCGDVYLYVTHGIFSRGLEALSCFSHVYCAHTINNNYKSNEKFTILRGDRYNDN